MGVGHWYNDLAWVLPTTWTVIKDKNDNDIAFLLHDKSNEKQRLDFEEKLKDYIKKNKRHNQSLQLITGTELLSRIW